jgi:hypothetical protein
MSLRAEGVAILVANPSLSVILSVSKNLEWLRAGSVKQSGGICGDCFGTFGASQ